MECSRKHAVVQNQLEFQIARAHPWIHAAFHHQEYMHEKWVTHVRGVKDGAK